MHRRILALLAFALLASLAVPGRAAESGHIFVYGNVKMENGTFVKVYLETRAAPGGILGNIALLGPSSRVMCYMRQVEWTSDSTVSVYGTLIFNGAPAAVQVDVARLSPNAPTEVAVVGWKVVSQEGSILWTSGLDAEERIQIKPFRGTVSLTAPAQ